MQLWISIKKWHKVLGELQSCPLPFQAHATSSSPCKTPLPWRQVVAWHLTRLFTMPLRTSGGCRRISAPAPLRLRRLCLYHQLPKGIMMLLDWALAAFGFRFTPCPPLWFDFHTTPCMVALMARFHLLLASDQGLIVVMTLVTNVAFILLHFGLSRLVAINVNTICHLASEYYRLTRLAAWATWLGVAVVGALCTRQCKYILFYIHYEKG